MPIGAGYPYYGHYVIPDIRETRASSTQIMMVNTDHVPKTFNMSLWQTQAFRYYRYWQWFSGEQLAEERVPSKSGDPILKYPLMINSVRNFARKHASILLGEETFETALPLVRCKITPKNPLNDSTEKSEDDKKLAVVCENIVNTVWTESNGRALQMENAILQQFLGGCVFQITWQPWRIDELVVPIIIRNIMPDYFLPIWQADDYWNLLEAFVVYRIPTAIAERQYGVPTQDNGMGWYTYCEHWTPELYSLYLDGKPITSDFSGETVCYKNQENPFGFVPFTYIPHLREGTFWGHSHVEDIEGLLKEFNARTADMGDSIRNSVHRRRYITDIKPGHPKPRKIDGNSMGIDLGATNPSTKAKPNIYTEDPPTMPTGVSDFATEFLWKQLQREGHISNIAFGEDEGSQRSALTLAFRMWPSTAHSRMERTFWTDGLNDIAKKILKMVVIKQKFISSRDDLFGLTIPNNFQRVLSFAQDWKPQIPRDREQMVEEVILRFQSGLLSPERALQMLGDVDYISEELSLIKEWLKFKADLGIESEDMQMQDQANTELDEPVIESSVADD